MRSPGRPGEPGGQPVEDHLEPEGEPAGGVVEHQPAGLVGQRCAGRIQAICPAPGVEPRIPLPGPRLDRLLMAAGRNTRVLDRLLGRGADAAVRVDTDPVDLRAAIADAAAGPVHVIIDYLWGPPTEAAIAAITHAGLRHTAPRVRLVEVGEMAGPTISLPASVLRSSGLRILGSGAGSVDPAVVVAALSRIMPRIADGSLRVPVRQARLDDVVQAWAEPDRDGERLVVVP